ncbi:hypothetical protein N0V88_007551 [Collariella sp. IMI 366227]|nr:hypothetical protein N0V88_007551 [Collariella sp. IMI 366227]
MSHDLAADDQDAAFAFPNGRPRIVQPALVPASQTALRPPVLTALLSAPTTASQRRGPTRITRSRARRYCPRLGFERVELHNSSGSGGGVRGFACEATTLDTLVTARPAIQARSVVVNLGMPERHPQMPRLILAKAEQTTLTTIVFPTASSATASLTTNPDELATGIISMTITAKPDETFTLIFETGDPTGKLGPENTASARSNRGGLGSLDRGTSIVIIVVVTVIAGLLLWIPAPNQRPFPLEIDQRLTDELNSRINRIYRRPDGKLVPEVDNPAVAASLARARSWKPNPNERRTQSFDQQDWKHEMTMKYLEGIVPGKTPGYTETKVEKKE